MKGSEKVILAIDIGGSKYMIGLVSSAGDILFKERHVWQEFSAAGVLQEISTAMEEVIRRFPECIVEAVGMTIPDLADPARGIWMTSCFQINGELPIADIIHDRFGYPVFIENDCNACALAEKYFGSCRDCNDFLYITVSNGVGGALFLNGELYYGAFGNAGEVGECVVAENGRLAESGRRGTLQEYASGRGLIRNYLDSGGLDVIDGDKPDGKSISKLAAEGDKSALQAFELEGYYLGKVIATACNLLNLKMVVIGGGLSLAFDYYIKSLEETVKKNTYPEANVNLSIMPTILGYEGGLMGAVTLAIRGIEEKHKRQG